MEIDILLLTGMSYAFDNRNTVLPNPAFIMCQVEHLGKENRIPPLEIFAKLFAQTVASWDCSSISRACRVCFSSVISFLVELADLASASVEICACRDAL